VVYICLCLSVLIALSGIATDVEVTIHEIQALLDEEDKQEKEFQVEYWDTLADCYCCHILSCVS